MGYTTDFSGTLELSRAATTKETDYINKFCETRRMKRDVNKLMKMYDGKYGHPTPKTNTPEGIYGIDGEYFVKDDGIMGQEDDGSIIDFNCTPGQVTYDDPNYSDFNQRWQENEKRIMNGICSPGLWCQWMLYNDGTELGWDGGEKFYQYVPWLKYLIEHFFEPWGIKLNGEILWQGEETNDFGKIIVKDNIVTKKIGRIEYH